MARPRKPFPRYAFAGPKCEGCGGETLLTDKDTDRFECLDCGKIVTAPVITDLPLPGEPEPPASSP